MRNAIVMVMASAAVLGVPLAATPDVPVVKITQLTESLHLLTTDQGSYTTNSIALVGDDGVLLVDTQSEDDARAFKQAVDAFGKGTPKYIINTHRHVEHVGGNAVFGNAPIVIAHELVPAKLRGNSYIFNEFPNATFPDITISDSMNLYFNNETIKITALPGSHDDNEIIVHFTRSKVVHLSSLVNGFNFPSVDSDGDALKFAELVARAMVLLPVDVVIVSGHNDVGTWEDLRSYHEMLIQTTAIVRDGLAKGKDLASLQDENVLAEWTSYAGSYVSVDEWIESLVEAIQPKPQPERTVYEPLYHVWKDKGADAAVAYYFELKRERSEEYRFDEYALFVIGNKLIKKGHALAATKFLEASLKENPQSRYGYYVNFRLAQAQNELGEKAAAVQSCTKALELEPEFEPATRLLEELKRQ